MHGSHAVLEPRDMYQALREIDLIPAQTHQFRHPQSMAVSDQEQGRIANTVPALGSGLSGDDLPDFLFRQIFSAAVVGIPVPDGNFPFYDVWATRMARFRGRVFFMADSKLSVIWLLYGKFARVRLACFPFSRENPVVLSPSDTSYRSLHPSPSTRELDEGYTPTVFELRFAEERTRTPASCLGLLIMLKTFQCLGYFVKVADVPNSVIRCIAKAAGFEELPDLSGYDNKTVRAEHKDLIRSWVGVSAFDTEAKRAMLKACVDISRVREDPADIVNFAIEGLIRQQYELPAFSALVRAAMKARAVVNRPQRLQVGK